MYINERMTKALDEVKAACEEQPGTCVNCPCFIHSSCLFRTGFTNKPEDWELEKTYKEVIVAIKF